MKWTTTMLLVGALTAGGADVASAQCESSCGAKGGAKGEGRVASDVGETKNLVETAKAAGSFQTLVAALKAAGLAETLATGGPYTVFAPTDEAFARLPEGTIADLLKPENKDRLVAILTYHVVPGRVLAKDVVTRTSAKTLQGSAVAIRVSEGRVLIDGAKVLKTDVAASNGVIHVIDTVLLPKEPESAAAPRETHAF